MRIGVVGDSHGNLENLRMAADYLVHERGVELLIHLGDNYEDADVLAEYGVSLLRVPGVYSDLYKDPGVANRLIEEFLGWRVLVTHSPKSHENDLPQDPKPEVLAAKGEVDIILYAHTHIPAIEEKEGVLWVNPGHLKDVDKKGYPPSMAILELQRDSVRAEVLSLKSKEVLQSSTYQKR